jgi:HSP20 family protein
MASESKEMQTALDERPAQQASETRDDEHPAYTPQADIYERADSLVAVIDMPGVDETSVDIQVERSLLTISGRVEEEPQNGYRPVYQEFESGRFLRQFTLSDEVDCGRIEATVQDGVLRIVLPKAEGARPRRIAVRAG